MLSMLSARGQSSQREENDDKSKIVYRERVGKLYSNTKKLIVHNKLYGVHCLR